MARTGEFIYLRTRGYLDVDHDSNQVRSFVCHNTLVDEEEGKRLVREMKKKFAIMIQESDFASTDTDVPAVENPAQLERAILSLITNLHNTPTSSVDDMVPSPADTHYSTDGHESDTNRSAKSPPLALIPPKPSTIKTSITKSVNIVVSASKGILNYRSNTSTSTTTTTATSSDNNNDGLNEIASKFSRPSVLQHAKGGSKSIELDASPSSSTSSSGKNDPFVGVGIKIKEEQPDIDSRVPPLPTSAGYFDMDACYDPSPQYLESVSSPLECKPFDLLSFNQQQSQGNDFASSPGDGTPSPYQSHYDQSIDGGGGGADGSSIPSPGYSDASPRSHGGLKRSRSIEELDVVYKRRLYSHSSNTTMEDSPDQFDSKPPLSLMDPCLNPLSDTDLSKFQFTIINIHLASNNFMRAEPLLDLEETLQSTFDVLDQSLLQMEENSSELQYQSTIPPQQLNEIMVNILNPTQTHPQHHTNTEDKTQRDHLNFQ